MYPCNWILSLAFLVLYGIIRAMYIEVVPNRKSPPAILLRQAYREDGKVKKRTLANLTDWPKQLIEGFRALLKGGKVVAAEREAVSILRSLPHGHVAAALGTLRAIGLDRVLGPPGNRRRDLVIAMVVSRLIAPGSKLATARGLGPATATSSLGEVLGLRAVDEDELYGALDWLLQRQPAIEKSLARKHLADGVLVLYDVTSSYLEGRCCPLAKLGYNRDGKKGKLQIVYGLLCAADGCPVALEVFDGDTADPKTLAAQIAKLKNRFGLTRVALVGDRGMITQARLDEEIKPGRARLDHRPAGAGDPGASRRRSLPARLVRRAGHGLDHLAGLSRRTADGLPQSGTGALAGQEARGLAERHRTPPRPDPRGCPPRPQSAARQDRNRVEGRRRAQQAQDGQTLRNDHRGRPLRLPPQSRSHRRGSRSRWLLCRAHQLADGHARRRRNRRRLQAPQRGRAGLPLPQDRGPGGPPHLPLGLAESESPCPFVHARLLRRTPYARQAGAAALRRHRPRSRGQAP